MSVLKILRSLSIGFILGYVVIHVFGLGSKTIHVDPILYKFGEMQLEKDIKFKGVIHLILKEGTASCSGWVIDRHYAITAAHCINTRGHIDRERIRILNDIGTDTEIRAHAVGFDSELDLGLIQGDFSIFQPVQTNFYSDGFPKNGDPRYFSLGYPLGQKILSMMTFSPIKMEYFFVKGEGHLIQGMSGGPTIDANGIAVGINSAVDENYSIIAPVQGFLGRFGLE